MIEPQRKIELPCQIEWKSMTKGKQLDRRFCKICARSVFDISSKNDKEIEKLFNEEGTNICVKSLSSQLTNQPNRNNPFKVVWRRVKFVGLILIASLISQDLSAQQKKKEPDSYHIVQNLSNSDTIIIKGIIKGERFIGWKKVVDASVKIWSEESINLGNFQTERNGKFEFSIDKKLVGDNFSISILAWDYKSIKIENLDAQDTELEVYLEEQETSVLLGRFF